MSLRTKIVLYNACALALAVLAAAVALAGFRTAFGSLRAAVTAETRAIDSADGFRTDLADEVFALNAALAGGDSASEAAFHQAHVRFAARLDQALSAADGPAREALAAAAAAESEFAVRGADALAERATPERALRLLAGSVTPARQTASAALDRYVATQETVAREAERRAVRDALATTAGFVALLAVAGAVAAALSLRLSGGLLDRLQALLGATGRIAGGARDVRVAAPTQGGDELDRLGRAFNRMTEQLAEAESSARRADDLKRSFLASVSHDLRTPLTTISGLLETLRRDDGAWDEATRRQFLDLASRESERLARLVANLLDLFRLEAGAWPLQLEAVNVAALARTVVDDLSVPGGVLRAHRLQVDAAPATALADESQLRRVLENLLGNAAKFSPPGSRIRVTVAGAGPGATARGSVVVRVEDEGPGVTADEAQRLFERYYRATPAGGAAARSSPPGSGLGLAICRAIVEANGGTIWNEPVAGAHGAAFAFALPAVSAPPEDDAGGPPAPAGPRAAAAPAATR